MKTKTGKRREDKPKKVNEKKRLKQTVKKERGQRQQQNKIKLKNKH